MPRADSCQTLPWVEKYRPTSLSNIVHHQTIVRLLREFIRSREMPHLFFYGPPGTGKTSTILSSAREVYKSHHPTMVLHLNASDERGIDVVRKQIIQFASTANFFCTDRTLAKLVVLDEADSMTKTAQMALRDIMMAYDTLFCLIGNYQYALIPSLQSRVVRLLFTPIPQSHAVQLGLRVLAAEGFADVQARDLEPVYEQTGGDMRQFLNVLQAIAMRCAPGDAPKTAAATPTTPTSNTFTRVHVKHVLCQWDDAEVATFMDMLRTHSVAACYRHLYTSIVVTHRHTLSEWLGAVADVLLRAYVDEAASTESSTASPPPTDAAFCDLMHTLAAVEHNASHAMYPDVQLLSMVACCHRYWRDEKVMKHV